MSRKNKLIAPMDMPGQQNIFITGIIFNSLYGFYNNNYEKREILIITRFGGFEHFLTVLGRETIALFSDSQSIPEDESAPCVIVNFPSNTPRNHDMKIEHEIMNFLAVNPKRWVIVGESWSFSPEFLCAMGNVDNEVTFVCKRDEDLPAEIEALVYCRLGRR